MSKQYVQHFHHLALTLLTEEEVDFLYKTLRKYQRTSDIGKLAKTLGQLLNTPERSKLLAYVRAPMSRSERNHFDKLLDIQDQGSISGMSLQTQGLLRRITTPPLSNSVLMSAERHVTIYGSRGGSMGFSIRGGSEFGLGIYVSNVRTGTPAAEAGLQVGDHIVSANGVDFHCVANSSAVKVLSSTALLNLVVVRCGKVPEWKVAREKVLWYDVALCRVVNSPPVSEIPTTSSQPNVLVERKVVITISQKTDFIGLNIRGGKEYGIGIYVSRVDPGGLASKVGLSAGDQIVKVNDSNFLSITHTDAVDALRASTHLIITIRSVGKFPVYKELYAEYTWSDASGSGSGPAHTTSISSVTGLSRIVTVPGDNASRKHTQRTRTRESSIDLTPLSYANSNNHIPDSDLDDAIEELDDCLETECKLFYPGDNDIMFRKDYEDSWQRIDALHDNYSRPEELTSSWSVDKHDSLGHHRHDSDLSDNMVDYTTFLEQSALREQQEITKQKTQTKPSDSRSSDDNVVIETTIEEGITSFVTNSHSPIVLSTHPMPDRFETDSTDQVYSQVTDLTGKTRVVSHTDTTRSIRSSSSSSQQSTPVYATVNKTRRSSKTGSVKSTRAPDVPPMNGGTKAVNGIDVNSKDEDLEVLTSQIQRLEARKSNLGSWEITRVAGGASTPTSPGSSETSFESYDKQKTGTWTSLKKKLKGSLRIGSANTFSGNSPSSPTSSLQQKGMFEKSFGSQILNSQKSERYNLMGMLEDHARILLTEDECKAVLRHIHNYHENKQLERLVELLLAILDKDDKKLLLVDVRNVIAPVHLERFDALIEHCNIQGYDQWLTKFNTNEETFPSPSQTRPVKPARSKNGVHSNGRTGSYDVTNPELNSDVPRFSKEDFEKMAGQLEVVIVESDEMGNRESPVVEAGEEIVYVSKHKIFLGLEVTGGRNDPIDQTIRIRQVRAGGAASDDHRLQPGVELTKVDGQSLQGMSQGEVESLLQTSFSTKKPVNLGIQIRRTYQL